MSKSRAKVYKNPNKPPKFQRIGFFPIYYFFSIFVERVSRNGVNHIINHNWHPAATGRDAHHSGDRGSQVSSGLARWQVPAGWLFLSLEIWVEAL
jgi:hypothetical protein